jgi:hypothetical protein
MLSKPSMASAKKKQKNYLTVPVPFKLSEARDLSEKSLKGSGKEFISLKTKVSKFFQEETFSSCRSSTKKAAVKKRVGSSDSN